MNRNLFFVSTALILNFLTDRLKKRIVENTESEWIQLKRGVPQGTTLGSLVFNIYVINKKNNLRKLHTSAVRT